jgi:hypothetical protein
MPGNAFRVGDVGEVGEVGKKSCAETLALGRPILRVKP